MSMVVTSEIIIRNKDSLNNPDCIIIISFIIFLPEVSRIPQDLEKNSYKDQEICLEDQAWSSGFVGKVLSFECDQVKALHINRQTLEKKGGLSSVAHSD